MTCSTHGYVSPILPSPISPLSPLPLSPYSPLPSQLVASYTTVCKYWYQQYTKILHQLPCKLEAHLAGIQSSTLFASLHAAAEAAVQVVTNACLKCVNMCVSVCVIVVHCVRLHQWQLYGILMVFSLFSVTPLLHISMPCFQCMCIPNLYYILHCSCS